MAQRTQVLLIDDLDGSSADETVAFGLDGSAYEIDLSANNADQFRKSLASYVANGRKSSLIRGHGRRRGVASNGSAGTGGIPTPPTSGPGRAAMATRSTTGAGSAAEVVDAYRLLTDAL